ncbi:Uncharacterised protein [Starkeya nomas]|uniref:Uncharacterized protein n=2 Tax=Starkeya nomas TaxID=2666134 RepID=A0A5S9R6F1_9HYPH|nr:Uncharacterised protein [Starkeya nomas]
MRCFALTSRNGALVLEREDGSPLEGKEALAELVAQWAEEVDGPEPSKDSLAFTISVPGALAAGDVAGGLGQMLGGHRYAWRLEELTLPPEMTPLRS